LSWNAELAFAFVHEVAAQTFELLKKEGKPKRSPPIKPNPKQTQYDSENNSGLSYRNFCKNYATYWSIKISKKNSCNTFQ